MSLDPVARISAIDVEIASIRAKIDELTATPAPAEGSDEATRSAFAALPGEVDELIAKAEAFVAERATLLARAERLAAISSLPAVPVVGAPSRRFSAPDVHVVPSPSDPFAVASRARNLDGLDVRSLALSGIDQTAKAGDMSDESAEHLTRSTQGRGTHAEGVARHILSTGGDEYREAFLDFLTHANSARAAMTLTPGANGGFMVPFTFDPTLILTNNGSSNPYRELATVKTTTTNDWTGPTSAGVTAQWLGELGVAADASPTVGQLRITPQKAFAFMFGSYEFVDDADFAAQLPGLLMDARDRNEETAFSVGTGTLQPWGVATRATAVNSAGAGAFAFADLQNLNSQLPPRYRKRNQATFLASNNILQRIRSFATGGSSGVWTDASAATPSTIFGYRAEEASSLVSTLTAGSRIMVFGDMKEYYIVDRIGMSMAYDAFGKDQATGRPNGTVGWAAYWRTGADVTTPNAFRVLNVT